jgi:hypothetical protein
MNEFAFLAGCYLEYVGISDLLVLSMRLADTPRSAIKYGSPGQRINEVLGLERGGVQEGNRGNDGEVL